MTKFEPASVIVHFDKGPTAPEQFFFQAYYPTVDEFTRLDLRDSASVMLDDDNGNLLSEIYVTVNGFDDLASSPKTFYDGASFVGYWTLVIRANMGEIVSLEWDDSLGCSVCPSGLCIEDNCSTPVAQVGCIAGQTSARLCDPVIFISWIGTDANGEAFTSSGLIPSAFRNFSVSNLYTAITGLE